MSRWKKQTFQRKVSASMNTGIVKNETVINRAKDNILEQMQDEGFIAIGDWQVKYDFNTVHGEYFWLVSLTGEEYDGRPGF